MPKKKPRVPVESWSHGFFLCQLVVSISIKSWSAGNALRGGNRIRRGQAIRAKGGQGTRGGAKGASTGYPRCRGAQPRIRDRRFISRRSAISLRWRGGCRAKCAGRLAAHGGCHGGTSAGGSDVGPAGGNRLARRIRPAFVALGQGSGRSRGAGKGLVGATALTTCNHQSRQHESCQAACGLLAHVLPFLNG